MENITTVQKDTVAPLFTLLTEKPVAVSDGAMVLDINYKDTEAKKYPAGYKNRYVVVPSFAADFAVDAEDASVAKQLHAALFAELATIAKTVVKREIGEVTNPAKTTFAPGSFSISALLAAKSEAFDPDVEQVAAELADMSETMYRIGERAAQRGKSAADITANIIGMLMDAANLKKTQRFASSWDIALDILIDPSELVNAPTVRYLHQKITAARAEKRKLSEAI
jgi:hypothetical protein